MRFPQSFGICPLCSASFGILPLPESAALSTHASRSDNSLFIWHCFLFNATVGDVCDVTPKNQEKSDIVLGQELRPETIPRFLHFIGAHFWEPTSWICILSSLPACCTWGMFGLLLADRRCSRFHR
jgi:hypothetical protein